MGYDLHALLSAPVTIRSQQRILISTGVALELPIGWEAQIRSRSGLARKHGIIVLNAPGTIDSDYRGEIGVLLINHGCKVYTINPLDRIAQLVFAQYEAPCLTSVAWLSATDRGTGGFGSTGT